MKDRIKHLEDAIGAVSVFLLDYMCAVEEAGYGDSMEFMDLKNRAQRLVGEFFDSILAQEAERIGGKMGTKEVVYPVELGYSDFVSIVKCAQQEEEWLGKLENLGVTIEYFPWEEMIEVFLRKYRDIDSVTGWFWDCIYDKASAADMWHTLIDDEAWGKRFED